VGKFLIPDNVAIEEAQNIDEGVLLGYRTGRKGVSLELRIGAGA